MNTDKHNPKTSSLYSGDIGLEQGISRMIAEGDEDFLIYLDKLGLSGEPNCLVLTASQHYYYNEKDLRNIRALVNLKRLNRIKNLDSFLHSLFRILPPDASFIGCFEESDFQLKGGMHSEKSSGLLKWFMNFLEKKSEPGLSKNYVYELLETHGFKISDMTEINGLNFFFARNVRKTIGPECY